MIAALLLLLGPQQPVQLSLKVDGVERNALVFPGSRANSEKSPLVFVFHGHYGTARQATIYGFQKAWPEATIVYPQGLKNMSPLVGYGNGWQRSPDADNRRDLKFVDALQREIRQRYKVDEGKVYATGMSNGGLFCYVLMRSRPEQFAAFAPVSAAGGLWMKGAQAKPVLIIHGETDKLVNIRAAKLTASFLERLGDCGAATQWRLGYDVHRGQNGNDVVTHWHSGGHMWPQDATGAIVEFFKGHG